MSTVTLRPVDARTLPELLEVATADAEPDDVMPPVPGPPGWTPERRAAYRTYLLADDDRKYLVMAEGRAVGMARLARGDAPGVLETGIWLGRSARGLGYGTETLRLLVDEARERGATALVAETTTANKPAIGALRNLGAKVWEDLATGEVHATLRLTS